MADAVAELERGRESYARRAWKDAYESLSRAGEATPLVADDLELLATAAYMLGRDDEWASVLERVHHVSLERGDARRAARSAIWVGVQLAQRGEVGRATGWLGRAQRLLEPEDGECAERGYLLLPAVFRHEAVGDFAAAADTAGAAAEIGHRFGDVDLFALAAHAQGYMLIKDGRVREGLALLDEAMVAITEGERSPIVTGLVYCGVILACQEAFELRRAQEWTAALTRWCEQQADLVAFTGRCHVHRAEILQLHGAWADALEEARHACRRQGMSPTGIAQAFYRQGEVHRLRGELDAAERAYREASRNGWEPQPGLALLWLRQGRGGAAAAAVRRALGETTDAPRRASLLPAHVEIMLAVHEVEAAQEACRELEEIAAAHESGLLGAAAAHARGAVDLAGGDTHAALVSLRRAALAWQELEVPYEAARTRVLVGLACRALGDEDSAAMELEAARAAFEELGAAPDAGGVASLSRRVASADVYGLTPRELEVLRLVAAGNSNREIASALVISEHTAARHLQNIFAKLRVSSRTAAGAFAFEHDLL